MITNPFNPQIVILNSQPNLTQINPNNHFNINSTVNLNTLPRNTTMTIMSLQNQYQYQYQAQSQYQQASNLHYIAVPIYLNEPQQIHNIDNTNITTNIKNHDRIITNNYDNNNYGSLNLAGAATSAMLSNSVNCSNRHHQNHNRNHNQNHNQYQHQHEHQHKHEQEEQKEMKMSKKNQTESKQNIHDSSETPLFYVCTLCNPIRRFKHKCNLNAHKKIHGDNAITCKYCNKRFARNSNLKQHIRLV